MISTASNQIAAECLSQALRAPDQLYVPGVVHEETADGSQVLVQWCGHPSKPDWTWKSREEIEGSLALTEYMKMKGDKTKKGDKAKK